MEFLNCIQNIAVSFAAFATGGVAIFGILEWKRRFRFEERQKLMVDLLDDITRINWMIMVGLNPPVGYPLDLPDLKELGDLFLKMTAKVKLFDYRRKTDIGKELGEMMKLAEATFQYNSTNFAKDDAQTRQYRAQLEKTLQDKLGSEFDPSDLYEPLKKRIDSIVSDLLKAGGR